MKLRKYPRLDELLGISGIKAQLYSNAVKGSEFEISKLLFVIPEAAGEMVRLATLEVKEAENHI